MFTEQIKKKIKPITEETHKWQTAQMNPNVMEKPQNTSEDNLEEPRNVKLRGCRNTESWFKKMTDRKKQTNKETNKNPDAVHFCDAEINQNHHILFCECSTFDFFFYDVCIFFFTIRNSVK